VFWSLSLELRESVSEINPFLDIDEIVLGKVDIISKKLIKD